MNTARVLLALAALAVVHSLPAAVRNVTKGGDYFPGTPPIDGTLRAAVEGAQAGDTITIASGLIVFLDANLTIAEGQDNLTITGPETGAAEIRTKIRPRRPRQNDPGFGQATVTVLSDGVAIRKVAMRDIQLNFGSDVPVFVQGATVQDVKFSKLSGLSFTNVSAGLIERCTLTCPNRGVGGNGLIEIEHGDGVTVRDCVVTQIAPSSTDTALSAEFTENVLFENNTLTNGDIYFYPLSGTLRNNRFPKRELDMALYSTLAAFGTTGPYLVEGNTCGAMRIHASNFTVRNNTISGQLAGKRPPIFTSFFYALNMIALDNTQPVVIEGNSITGSNGATLNIDAGSPGAVIHDNTISNVDFTGLRVSAEAPVEVSENLFERCGNRKLGVPGRIPVPALLLAKVETPSLVVRENTFSRSIGAAIVVGEGSPIFQANRITRGPANGMIFHSSVTPVFMGTNTIELLARAGVLVKPGAAVTVEHAVFEGNGIAGISVEAGGKVTARDNRFTAQLGPGIKVADAVTKDGATSVARALVDACQFTLNKGAGVLVGKGGVCEIAGGSFIDNVRAGIDLAPDGVTPNTKPKLGNGDIDFPEQLTFDATTRTLRGKAEPGALVQMYRTEKNGRRGNTKNGEGAMFVGSTTATGGGDFALPPGPTTAGDMFTFTATRPATGVIAAVTSEFSENIPVPPSPPIELISQSSNEEAGNGVSLVNDWNVGEAPQVLMTNTSVSTDGRFVLFHSAATNLVNDDTNNAPDLFLRDRANGTTERVNVTSSGGQAGGNFAGQPARVGHGSLSADGRWVVFASESTNLVAGDENSTTDIFLRDRQTGTTIAVTDPTEQPDMSVRSGGWDCSISADGNVIALVTRDSRFTGVGTNGEHRILVWTRSTGQFEEVSPPPAPAFFHNPRLSADGRFVVFSTRAKLVAADTDSRDDIYLRDRQASATERLSVTTAGAAMGGASPSISADGRFVAFASASSGDPADTDSQPDIYVRDRQLGTTTWASQPPVGLDPGFGRDCSFPSLSADGRTVAYEALGTTTRPGEATVLVEDIYVRDRQLGVTIEANVGVAGDVRGGSGFPVMSPDGRQVIFGGDGLGFTPGDVQPLSEVFARTISPADFEAP